MTIYVIGAGMSGLLAANMLRYHNVVVWEAQPNLPNNHHAVLRFRSEAVGDVLGIPFSKVKMQKGYVPWRNPIADNIAYSRKVTGQYRNDRSILTTGIETHTRYIAPVDFIERMAARVRIFFDNTIPLQGFDALRLNRDPVISTIPMPALMDILKYPHKPEFGYVSGQVYKAHVKDCFMHISVYVPDPTTNIYRVSVTGSELSVECLDCQYEDVDLDYALDILAIDTNDVVIGELHKQPYAKINTINEEDRKRFLHWATDEYGIYSLGRFATWRPGLLLDDLVKDVRVIERLMRSKYDLEHYRATENK